MVETVLIAGRRGQFDREKGTIHMRQRVQPGKVTDAAPEPSSLVADSVSRRWLLRALPGAAIGFAALLGLTSCGGEGDEGDEGDDD